MSGIKISQATPFAAAQDNDQFAVERGGASGSLTLKKMAVQAGISEGFLKGDPSGVYAQNQTNDDKWQLDQKGLNIFGAEAATVNPDCTQNYCFNLQVDGDCTLDNPTNVPATNLGPFYFRLFAFTSDATSTLSFSANMVEMSGSKPWDVLNENIIHCWYIPALGQTFYRVDNALALPGEVQIAEITIPSAQILTANATPVELIPAPGAGKWIAIRSCVNSPVDGTTGYNDGAGSNVPVILFDTSDVDNLTQGVGITLGNISTTYSIFNSPPIEDILNTSLKFFVSNAELSGGDYDLYIRIAYEIVDSPV